MASTNGGINSRKRSPSSITTCLLFLQDHTLFCVCFQLLWCEFLPISFRTLDTIKNAVYDPWEAWKKANYTTVALLSEWVTPGMISNRLLFRIPGLRVFWYETAWAWHKLAQTSLWATRLDYVGCTELRRSIIANRLRNSRQAFPAKQSTFHFRRAIAREEAKRDSPHFQAFAPSKLKEW